MTSAETFCRFLAGPACAITLVRCHRHRAASGWAIPARRHGDHLLYLLQRGSLDWELDGRALRQQSGQALWVGPGVVHRCRPSAKPVFWVLRVGLSGLAGPLAAPMPWRMLEDAEALAASLDAIEEAASLRGICQDWRLRAALLGLFASALDLTGPHGLSRPERQLLRELLTREPAPSPARLAAVLGRSPSSLRRAFLAAHGCPPRVWLHRRRLAQAAELLRDGMEPAATAASCGYRSLPSFNRLFAQAYGLPPGRWARR